MKKLNRKFFEILAIICFSLTPLLWFVPNQIILGHDSGFRLDPVKQLQMLFYSWNPGNNFGADWTFFKGFLGIQLPEAVFTALFHSVVIGQRITLIFWFFLMGIAMYYCLNYFFSKKEEWFLRIFGTLFYVYNFFILQGWFIAERAKFSLYAALPIGFVILYATLERKISLIKGLFFFSLIYLFLNGGGNPPLFGGILIAYGSVVTIKFVSAFLQKKWLDIVHVIVTVLVFVSGVVAISAYWISQQFFLVTHSFSSSLASTGGMDGILGWESVISKHASILNLFRLEGVPDWYDNPFHPYSHNFLTNPLLISLSFVPFLIILVGFFIFKTQKNKVIYSALCIFFLSIIFTGGTHPPLGIIYSLLMQHFPGFVIFRSSYYKFAPALFFSLSILTAYYLQLFISKVKKSKRTVISVFAILVLLAFNYPYFFNNFFNFNNPFTTKVTLPNYVNEMADYLSKSVNPSTRILLLPDLDPNLNADSYIWGYWSLDILPRLLTNNTFIASDSNNNLVKNLYRAIREKNEPLFLDISQRLGIQKILWRGDILYSDKLTRAENVIEYRNSLVQFKSVSVDKSFGQWELYSVNNSHALSLFYPVQTISQVASNELRFEDIGSLTDSDSSVWITQEQGQIPQEIKQYVSKEVVGTPCESCSLNAVLHVRQGLAMPATVSLLPWSKFYFLVGKKEQKLLSTTENSPAQRIDVDLSLENARLVEIWKMAFKDFNKNAEVYITKNTEKYKALVNDSLNNFHKLSGQQENSYAVKMLAYLQMQHDYIQFFNQNLLIKNDIDNILSFIDVVQNDLQKNIWISTSNEERRSYVSLPASGQYTIKINPSDDIQNITFNDLPVNNLDALNLPEGDNKIQVQYVPQQNVIQSEVFDNEQLKKGQKIDFPIENFLFDNNYYFYFRYKVEKGGYVKLVVHQNNKNGIWKGNLAQPIVTNLLSDGQWHVISDTYAPYVGASFATFSLESQRNSMLSVSDISVENLINPSILFIEKKNSQMLSQPNLTFIQLDPTGYSVSVRSASGPWIMQFNQAFNRGWKAYILPEQKDRVPNWLVEIKTVLFSKSIPEQDHIMLNEYSNGWYMQKNGAYTILVIFTPQVYFYLGLFVTILTLIILGEIYVFKKNK